MTKALYIFTQKNRNNWQSIVTTFNRKLHNELLKQRDYDFQVEIKKVKKNPTNEQRAYYFGVVLPIIRSAAAEQGNHYPNIDKLDDDIREVIKDEFSLFVEHHNKLTGKTETKPISLSNIKGDKEIVWKYIESVILWAERWYNIEIPEAGFSNKKLRGYE